MIQLAAPSAKFVLILIIYVFCAGTFLFLGPGELLFGVIKQML